MLCQSCVPYRGYGIVLSVAALESTSFEGEQQRYTVSWTIQREDGLLQDTVGSFTESSHFTSTGEALDFGDARAHTFIDGMVASRVDR
jgi:hypothetical protein